MENYRVVITAEDGSKITADDSVVARQGTAAYTQICRGEDVIIKDSAGNIIFIPHRNIVKVDVSEPGDEPSPEPSVIGTRKQVAFFDYDGTITNTYSVEEFAELSELPANPSHEGLVAQGWNWSLSDAQEYLEKYPDADMNIGQMYITESGDTEIDIELDAADRLSPYLALCVDGSATIDWGDGSTDTVTGSDLTDPTNTKHEYAAVGNYMIKIHVDNGTVALGGYEGNYGACPGCINDNFTSSSRENKIYQSAVKSVKLGNNTQIGIGAFIEFNYCETIILPYGVTSLPKYGFNYCYSIKHLTVPNSVSSIGDTCLYYCESLSSLSIAPGLVSVGEYGVYATDIDSITLPETLTTLELSSFGYNNRIEKAIIPDNFTVLPGAFESCESLKTLIFPNDIVGIGDSAFSHTSVKSVIIPDSVISYGNGVFDTATSLRSVHFPDGFNLEICKTFGFRSCSSLTSIIIPEAETLIDQSAFRYCSQLEEITIPENVTRINTFAFDGCPKMKAYHFKSTTPPTLANRNAFNGIPNDTIIYVPQGSLSAYQSATNWSNYASQMQEEPE